jgi:peptidyl-dipeptidase Dcp
VELPSQIMENWVFEPEVLKAYAKHYETGEVIPQELIDKLKKTGTFNQGFATVEYLAASYLDMDWHTLEEIKLQDAEEFEKKSMNRIGLIPEIVVRYKSPYFNHIFSGGYSSGYYSYIWAEVLDSDAFQAFKETSLFDQKVATSYRENILAPGGTEDPMTLYVRFRGSEPSVEPLLKKRGLM